jgi:hypothetical protein
MADSRRVEAVADTSFLIALQWLELLETLGQVHTRVLVPERMWDEFAEGASEAELAAAARIGVAPKCLTPPLRLPSGQRLREARQR